jgi:phosphoglycolate phosphatase-like HAD superfamily hydrolase
MKSGREMLGALLAGSMALDFKQEILTEQGRAVSVGDPPYDAIAAGKVGIVRIVGTLTGGFSPAALQEAGCSFAVETAADVLPSIER